jgi:hypothetical protein
MLVGSSSSPSCHCDTCSVSRTAGPFPPLLGVSVSPSPPSCAQELGLSRRQPWRCPPSPKQLPTPMSPTLLIAALLRHRPWHLARWVRRTSVTPSVKTESWPGHQRAATGRATLRALSYAALACTQHCAHGLAQYLGGRVACGAGPRAKFSAQALAGRSAAKPAHRSRVSAHMRNLN